MPQVRLWVVVDTAGLSPKEWLAEMKDEAPHWWPPAVGGGAKGGQGGGGSFTGADNPWSKDGWNITKQGQLVTQLGAAYLGGTRLGALAGSGLVTELRPGATRQLSAALAWDPAPWCPMVF